MKGQGAGPVRRTEEPAGAGASPRGVEDARASILRRLALLDTAPEAAFDTLARLAHATFQTSSVLISFLDADRQWFKARVGFELEETSRRIALCHTAIAAPEALTVVEDTRLDPRFWNNPLVKGAPFIRFYAAAPLLVEGVAIGTLCLLCTAPRYDFGSLQRQALAASGAAVEELLRLRLETGERRAREAGLEVARRQMAMAEELVGVGHWTLDLDSHAVTWSPQVYAIHGLDPATFDPGFDDVLGFYEPESRARLEAAIERSLVAGEGYALKARLVRPSDGVVRTVLSRAEVSHDGGRRMLVGAFQDVTEQDDLLRQVSEERERYKLITQNATDVIATYTPDGTFTFLSPAIAGLCGRSPADLIGRRTFELIHPDDHARVWREFRALVESGDRSRRIEYRLLREGAPPLWVEAHPMPMFDAAGALTGFQDVTRDVSARRAAETAARESEQRFRLLAENANDMIVLTSPKDGRILFASPGCRRVMGYEPEELVGRTTLSMTHPDDRAEVVRMFQALVAAGPSDTATPRSFRRRHKDGSWIWLEGQPRVQFDEDGTPLHVHDVVRDITARKRAEDAAQSAARVAEDALERAQASETRYRLLAENATDIIAKYGLDGKISFASPSCLKVLGYAPEELVGRKTVDLIHPDDLARVRAQFADHLGSDPPSAPLVTRHRLLRKTGEVVWTEGRPVLVRSDDGAPTEFYDVMRDVTSQVELERDLEAARDAAEAAARAKSDFLANMSHELRTPLTGILGYADVLAAAPELELGSRRHAELIGRSGRNLLTLVNDVLDLSKIEASGVDLAPQPVDLCELLAAALDVVRPQAQAKGLALHADLPRRPVGVAVDPDRLRQVLLNLLGNALKFTAAGEIRLSLRAAAGGPGRRTVEIAVRDSGIGMTAAQAAQVFDRFEQADASITRRFGGTGLGLSISRAIVEAMGGSVGVESAPGLGSTFTVRLDLASAEPSVPELARPQAAPASPLRGLKVLLAEDVHINRELIQIFLARHQVTLTGVEDGAQAVAAAGHDRFDLILMDMQMPVLDGLEATRLIRRSGGPCADTPILALTANVLPAEVAKCRAAGMTGHVGKPFSAESLAAAMEAAMTAAPPP